MVTESPDANAQVEESSAPAETTDEAVETTVAESSPADGATEESTLSIVRDVVVDKKEEETKAASPAEGSEEGQSTDEEPNKPEQDDEKFSDVPFNKHPRFQKLLQERNDFKKDADSYRNVQTFMDNNGISAEEAAEGFVIMGMMKTDPAAAWERLKPYVQSLLTASGEVLPDDLANRVQMGEMTRDAAFEVSRSRAQLESYRNAQVFREQQAEQRRQQEYAGSLIRTAEAWEADRRAKDPNFEQKLVPLKKELAFIQMQEGKPTTLEGVQDQLKRAYAAVVLPAPITSTPQPVRPRVSPRPTMAGQGKGNAQPAPQSTLDIIRAVRGGS
jgi:hypothetical protein